MPRNIDLQLDLLTDKEGPFSLHLVRNIEGLEFKPVYVIRENSDGIPSLVKVCPFVLFLLAIMLSVLRFTDSDYHFGIFKLFIYRKKRFIG
jgi:hypothetical protein